MSGPDNSPIARRFEQSSQRLRRTTKTMVFLGFVVGLLFVSTQDGVGDGPAGVSDAKPQAAEQPQSPEEAVSADDVAEVAQTPSDEPANSDGPAESGEPAESDLATEPTKSDEPTEPTESDEPTEPTESDEPTEPEDSTGSTESTGTPESPDTTDIADSAAAVEPADAVEPATKLADGILRFNFRYQPWKDVLDWFATECDLSLVMDAPPPGTFNYTDSRGYSPTEALDRLNGVLLTKNYTLVRRGRMLMVINLDDGIPPNLVGNVALDDLDKHGEHELVRVVFPLNKLTAEEAAAEVERLLGPQGLIVPLVKSRQIRITETAGRLRVIRSVLEAIENPTSTRGKCAKLFWNIVWLQTFYPSCGK